MSGDRPTGTADLVKFEIDPSSGVIFLRDKTSTHGVSDVSNCNTWGQNEKVPNAYTAVPRGGKSKVLAKTRSFNGHFTNVDIVTQVLLPKWLDLTIFTALPAARQKTELEGI